LAISSGRLSETDGIVDKVQGADSGRIGGFDMNVPALRSEPDREAVRVIGLRSCGRSAGFSARLFFDAGGEKRRDNFFWLYFKGSDQGRITLFFLQVSFCRAGINFEKNCR